MIGQYLLNNNEKRYNTILPNFSDLNRPLVRATLHVAEHGGHPNSPYSVDKARFGPAD
jgi:hypothetical protein